jgi:hypothetical protein
MKKAKNQNDISSKDIVECENSHRSRGSIPDSHIESTTAPNTSDHLSGSRISTVSQLLDVSTDQRSKLLSDLILLEGENNTTSGNKLNFSSDHWTVNSKKYNYNFSLNSLDQLTQRKPK